MERVPIVQNHPLHGGTLIVVQGQKITVQLTSHRVVVLETDVQALDAFGDGPDCVIIQASKPRPH